MLTRALDAHRRAGLELHDLTSGNPTRAGLPYPAEAIVGALADPANLEYAPVAFGLVSAREAVRAELRKDGLELPLERVVLTASTSEAYAHAFAILADPGDEVLVPEPSYPLFEHLAQLSAVSLRPYRLAYDGAWHIDRESLRAAVTPACRAVVVVSPNNPTGSFLKRAELAALEELGLPVLSDEVFSRYALGPDPDRAPSALALERVLVIALGGLSKLVALPQLKLAWMLLGGPDDQVAEASRRLELVTDTFLSVSAPVQHALPSLLAAGREVTDAIRARVRANHRRLCDVLASSPATPLHLEGGWYAVVRLPRVHSEEQWVLGLLCEAHVLVQPGWYFDFREEAFVVLSLIGPEAEFAEGVTRLASFVAARSA